MYKKIILFLLANAIATPIFASGSDHLSIERCVESACVTVSLDELPKTTKYLGSTKSYHFFAEVESGVSKPIDERKNTSGAVSDVVLGMPWRSVRGYRLSNTNEVPLSGGWQIEDKYLDGFANVNVCPRWRIAEDSADEVKNNNRRIVIANSESEESIVNARKRCIKTH